MCLLKSQAMNAVVAATVAYRGPLSRMCLWKLRTVVVVVVVVVVMLFLNR